MDTLGPHADWYPDPSGQPNQRWWDGTAWSTQTRPYPAPFPRADAYEPSVDPSAASAFQPPPPAEDFEDGRGLENGGIFATWLLLGPFSLIFAWYSNRISRTAKFVWTGLVAAQVVVAIVIFVSLTSSTGLNDGGVATFVEQNVGSSITGTASSPSDATVDDAQATCVQATSNSWDCSVTYTLSAPAESIDQNYIAAVTVTCDSTGECSYPGFIPVPSQ